MPTIKRTITEYVRKDVKAEMGHVCCDEMAIAMKKDDYGPKLYSGSLTVSGRKINCCPFCGEKVIYDDTVILPEGYERKLP
jgi:hypothetical protein